MEEPQVKMTCIKLAMLGDSKVGKTSICQSYMNMEFSDNYLSTIGREKYDSKIKMKNGEEIKLIIYDTAGQERYHSICSNALKSAQGVVVVFDLGDRKSFEHVKDWLKSIKDNGKDLIVLFGNKCDIDESQRVAQQKRYKNL